MSAVYRPWFLPLQSSLPLRLPTEPPSRSFELLFKLVLCFDFQVSQQTTRVYFYGSCSHWRASVHTHTHTQPCIYSLILMHLSQSSCIPEPQVRGLRTQAFITFILSELRLPSVFFSRVVIVSAVSAYSFQTCISSSGLSFPDFPHLTAQHLFLVTRCLRQLCKHSLSSFSSCGKQQLYSYNYLAKNLLTALIFIYTSSLSASMLTFLPLEQLQNLFSISVLVCYYLFAQFITTNNNFTH